MFTILLQRIDFRKLLMLALPLFLAGCTSLFGSSLTEILKNDANASSDFYLNKASQAKDIEDRQTYKLLAARVMVTENKIAQAQAQLSGLTDLNEEQLLDKSLVDASIAAAKKDNQQAEIELQSINSDQLSRSQKARYYQIKAKIAENSHDILAAVRARIEVDYMLTDTQRKQENIDRTWALLRTANKAIVNTDASGEPALAGWLALTGIYNDNVAQPARLTQALQNWRNAYPGHSAAFQFPTELQSVLNFQPTVEGNIGLILPLSGDNQFIGTTIKSGFDDARGADTAGTTASIQYFDSAADDVGSIVEQAAQSGISTLVGPLLKQNVDTALENFNIANFNVLALNSTPMSKAMNKVCYYGLAPEDEAEDAATKMWNDGIRTPLVIVPQNDLGQRTADAFNIRWQRLSATDSTVKFYNSPDDIVYNLQDIVGRGTQAVYVIVTAGEQLQAIKTALDNGNYGVKVYASSRSNSSNNGPEFRLFMEGVKFSDIPFFADTASEQYKKVEAATNGNYQLMRLYAMGSDAWLLSGHFNELRQVPGYSLNGLTGKLSAGPNCNIQRDMSWFQYQNGEVVSIN